MKIQWIATIIISVSLLAAGTNEKNIAKNDDLYHKSGNTINAREHADLYNPENTGNNDNFGFVRQVKSPVPGETIDIRAINSNDRENTANKISKMTVTLPNVVDSSVVVTDQEVLIAYLISDEDEQVRFETADRVKQTVLSAVPRWYDVYLTDDPALRQDVKNIASMNAYSRNKIRTVRKTVKLMLERSPQGRQWNDIKNKDGVNIGNTQSEPTERIT